MHVANYTRRYASALPCGLDTDNVRSLGAARAVAVHASLMPEALYP